MNRSQKFANSLRERARQILDGEIYAIGDFRPAIFERAFAIDLALFQAELDVRLGEQGSSLAFADVFADLSRDETIRLWERVELDKFRALISHYRTSIFSSRDWAQSRATEIASLVTGNPPSCQSESQKQIWTGLSAVFLCDLLLLSSSVGMILGDQIDQNSLEEQKAQILSLILYHYGCLTLFDIAPEQGWDRQAVVKTKRRMFLVKRVFDLPMAALLLLITSPVFVVISCLLAFEGRPIFFSQQRIGRRGRVFRCHKFRTMVPSAEQILAELLKSDAKALEEWVKYEKLRDDPRITRVGKFLRRTSLDELPQLLNVLKGEMILVGPRPMAIHERDRWKAAYRSYTMVRPGLTGPWQIHYRTGSEYDTRIESFIQYVENWSLAGDIKLLFMTPQVAFSLQSGL